MSTDIPSGGEVLTFSEMPTDIASSRTMPAAQETLDASNPILSNVMPANQDTTNGADDITSLVSLALGDKSKAPSCRLLKLPSELRNHIYRLVLHRDNTILIDSTGYQRDGLLSTCKKVRRGATKIYYYENDFEMILPA